jgi:hypothetical protein
MWRDPPIGHGEHRYALQLFALDADTPDLPTKPGRPGLMEAIPHVLAAGLLVGAHSRGEPAAAGPVGATAAAAS